ncbi:MAG: VOC family protein [Desulfatiglandales bacterium]|jgi:catechol 2,3-dioxygenase-like lactoylglutathione lyase family enzyme|nr:VOC family protein [Desulfatiglandales bacterium]HJO63003.1 VOC family protein [Desulfobacterales bacterium]|tara:strand:- start:116 stop:499 length:384 start_codon:yes stop_codon:yes gene_type:complete
MFKRVDHVEIVPSDFEKSIDFYVTIFGFKVKGRNKVDWPPMKEIAYVELGDTVIEFISAENPAPKSTQPFQVGYKAIALEVEEMDKSTEYLKGKGIDITMGPVDLGDSMRAEIQDPDGLTIELRQWK